MDVRIYDGEEIRVTAIDAAGNEHHSFISFEQILNNSEKIVDGLSASEIKELNDRKKIMAIKLYRLRTGCNIKKAKEEIEAWVERNRCCNKWPYCEHEEVIQALDMEKLICKSVGGLSLVWKYPGIISEEQAMTLQTKAGRDNQRYGFFSFQQDEERNESRWASNREIS